MCGCERCNKSGNTADHFCKCNPAIRTIRATPKWLQQGCCAFSVVVQRVELLEKLLGGSSTLWRWRQGPPPPKCPAAVKVRLLPAAGALLLSALLGPHCLGGGYQRQPACLPCKEWKKLQPQSPP